MAPMMLAVLPMVLGGMLQEHPAEEPNRVSFADLASLEPADRRALLPVLLKAVDGYQLPPGMPLRAGQRTAAVQASRPVDVAMQLAEDAVDEMVDEGISEELNSGPMTEMDMDGALAESQEELDRMIQDSGLESLASYTNDQKVNEMREKYKMHPTDTGSSQVQVAVLTARIQYMTAHMQNNKKDYASLRGLTAMVTRRRKLLEYLLREDINEFKRITSELGIRTNQLLKPKLQGARGRRVGD